jgi:alpha-D-ribose 1-methylphosphonate 5-phosphate C-P lyase
LDRRPHPILLGAGRRARLTALPPFTSVQPLAFEDRPLQSEYSGGACVRCGSTRSYRVSQDSGADWMCTDADACRLRSEKGTP